MQRLARGLVRVGHEVTVVHDVDAYNLLYKGPQPPPVEEPAGLTVVPLKSRLGALSCALTQQTGRPLVHGRRIRKLLVDGEYDVVNFHNVSLIGGPGILSYGGDALRLYIAHEHWLVCPMHVLWRHKRERCTGRQCLRCAAHNRRPPQLYRYTGYMERQLAAVDTFIALSDFSRDKHKEFGFPHDMEVLPSFLPAPSNAGRVAPLQPSRPYFLFVGRLEKIKGLDDVIPVFRDYPEADLIIAGDGEYAGTLRDMAAGVPNIKFLGRVSMEELPAYYERALALIVPSVCFETFGITLIEAMSFGIPIIARRLGPFPEIIEKSGAGDLFESADELLASMKSLHTDASRRARLSQRARSAFKEYWAEDVVVSKYLDIVRRTAEQRARPGVVSGVSRTDVA